MSNNKKTENKKKRRQQRLEEKKKHEGSKSTTNRPLRRSHFPQINVSNEGADQAFIKYISDAVKKLRFDNSALFTPRQTEAFRLMKVSSLIEAVEYTEALANEMAEKRDVKAGDVYRTLDLGVGQAIFSLIPEEVRKAKRSLIPYNDFHVLIEGNDYRICFSSMEKEKTTSGTVFYSPHRPKLIVDEHEYIVGFSSHAIEAICDRLTTRWWWSYGAAGDVHSFLMRCMRFDYIPWTNRDIQEQAFTFFGQCGDPGFMNYRIYVRGILGEDKFYQHRELGDPYFRLGYCPISLEKGFAKALTLYFPGHFKTPENKLIDFTKIPKDLHQGFREFVKELNADQVMFEPTVGLLLKWFHDNGIPQVVQSKESWYYPHQFKGISNRTALPKKTRVWNTIPLEF